MKCYSNLLQNKFKFHSKNSQNELKNNEALDFDDLFTAKSARGEYPFNPSRFENKDLTKRAMTRKLTQNPGLNFTPNTPFFDDNNKVTPDYQLFEGLGRFNQS